jgi:pilus assembly protein Flp/PilA
MKKKGERKMKKFMRFLKEEDGVTAIEYGLIASLIAVVIILAVTGVGNSLNDTFTTVEGSLAGS